MTEHSDRTASEYKRLLDEAVSAAGKRQGAEWNDAFIAALADRNLTLAMSVHPHSRREWYPSGYPYTAQLAFPASNAWPEASLIVWTPEFAPTTKTTKTITLTVEQWEIIRETVHGYWDCGPEGEGWQSDELASASAALSSALDEAVADDKFTPTAEMKLYAFPKFSPSHNAGLAFAIAESEKHARELILERLGFSSLTLEFGPCEVFQVTEAVAFGVLGGD